MTDPASTQPVHPLQIPNHVAIVMDGNGRWAQRRWLPRVAGHKQGVDALRRVVAACLERKVRVLTVFAFSSENWSRPADEVSGLMELLVMALSREVPKLEANGVQLHFPGAKQGLSDKVLQGLEQAERATRHNDQLILNVCFNYGGRWDMVQAARSLASKGVEITEASLSQAMSMAHVSDPDLMIRTSGEKRISNFLLWQAAYTELYFTECLWPDFDAAELDRALTDYAGRQRRFGQTAEQCVPVEAALVSAGRCHA